MASFARHVDVEWNGTLMEGNGTAKAGTGAFTLPVTFRVASPNRRREDHARGTARRRARDLLRDGADQHDWQSRAARRGASASPRR